MYFLPAAGADVVLEGRPLAAAHTVALATTTRSVTAMRTVALAIVSIITDCVRTVQTPPRLVTVRSRHRRRVRGHSRTLAQPAFQAYGLLAAITKSVFASV